MYLGAEANVFMGFRIYPAPEICFQEARSLETGPSDA